jgi:hypothetical protein
MFLVVFFSYFMMMLSFFRVSVSSVCVILFSVLSFDFYVIFSAPTQRLPVAVPK